MDLNILIQINYAITVAACLSWAGTLWWDDGSSPDKGVAASILICLIPVVNALFLAAMLFAFCVGAFQALEHRIKSRLRRRKGA